MSGKTYIEKRNLLKTLPEQAIIPVKIRGVENDSSFNDLEDGYILLQNFPLPESNSESGIYTPEASGLVNLDDCTPRPSYYTRVGNIVTIQGRVSYIPTAAGALDFTLTLPFTSTSSVAFLMQITTDLDGSFINAASPTSTIPIGFTSLGLGTDLVFTMSYSIV
jgi:hypothetical protein